MTGPVFRVVWLHSVRSVWMGHLLLDLSARGETSNAVFEALDRINAKLATNPEAKGESREPGWRWLHVPPLAVTYEVHPEEGVVIVVNANYVRR